MRIAFAEALDSGRKFVSLLVITVSIIAGILDSGAAEMDLATVLVGRWEGELAQPKKGRGTEPPERTLIINSVTKTDSGWRVDAVFGVSGKELVPVQVTLDTTVGAPKLSFLSGSNGRVEPIAMWCSRRSTDAG